MAAGRIPSRRACFNFVGPSAVFEFRLLLLSQFQLRFRRFQLQADRLGQQFGQRLSGLDTVSFFDEKRHHPSVHGRPHDRAPAMA